MTTENETPKIAIQQNRATLQWYTVDIGERLGLIHVYSTPLGTWSYQIDSFKPQWGERFGTAGEALSNAIDVVRAMLFFADAQIRDYDDGNKDFPEWRAGGW